MVYLIDDPAATEQFINGDTSACNSLTTYYMQMIDGSQLNDNLFSLTVNNQTKAATFSVGPSSSKADVGEY